MLFGTEAFEIEILNGIQLMFGCSAVDWIMKTVSFLGNSGAVWLGMALTLIAIRKTRRTGIMLAAGLLLGLLIGNLLLKNIIARPRPCWIVEDVQLLVSMPKDYSFPSGHTLASFISAFILLSEQRKIGIPAVILATVIAFSRMYLFVHFPTDIVGGIVLGFIIAKVTVRVVRKLLADK